MDAFGRCDYCGFEIPDTAGECKNIQCPSLVQKNTEYKKMYLSVEIFEQGQYFLRLKADGCPASDIFQLRGVFQFKCDEKGVYIEI